MQVFQWLYICCDNAVFPVVIASTTTAIVGWCPAVLAVIAFNTIIIIWHYSYCWAVPSGYCIRHYGTTTIVGRCSVVIASNTMALQLLLGGAKWLLHPTLWHYSYWWAVPSGYCIQHYGTTAIVGRCSVVIAFNTMALQLLLGGVQWLLHPALWHYSYCWAEPSGHCIQHYGTTDIVGRCSVVIASSTMALQLLLGGVQWFLHSTLWHYRYCWAVSWGHCIQHYGTTAIVGRSPVVIALDTVALQLLLGGIQWLLHLTIWHYSYCWALSSGYSIQHYGTIAIVGRCPVVIASNNMALQLLLGAVQWL